MFWLLVVGFALRAEYIAVDHSYIIAPDKGYFGFGYETGSIARALASGEGFSSPFRGHTGPTAWIGPIYVGLCALVFKLFGIFSRSSAVVLLGLNALFSALNACAIYRLGQRTVGEVAARLAAWSWALLPAFMQWACTRVWETSPSALLLTLGLLLALDVSEEPSNKRWVYFGAFWAFAALTNPALVTTGPLLGFWLLLRGGGFSRPSAAVWKPALYAIVAFTLVVAPWMARNYLVFHHPVFIRGNFGFEFRLGNFPNSNGMGWSGLHPTLNHLQYERYVRLGEYEFVRQSSREAWGWVRSDPGAFLALSLKRALYFWDGRSLLYSEHWIEDWDPRAYLLSSLLAIGGAVALALRRHPRGWVLIIPMLIYPLPYYIAYPHARYRHAIEPAMVLLAAYLVCTSIEQLFDKIRQRKLT